MSNILANGLGNAAAGAASGAASGVLAGPVGSLVGAGIGALSGLVGNLIQGASARKQQARQQEYNKEMLRIQNDYNTQMFNAANEWNSPVNERARLEAAGINPLQINGDAGAANAPQSAAANPLNMYPAINPAANIKELALATAQLENLRADTAKKSNENLTETQRRENMTVQLEKDRQEIENMRSQKGLTDMQTEQINRGLQWIDRLGQANESAVQASAELSKSQRKRIETLLEGERLLQSKSLQDFEERWKKIAAEIAKMSKETGILQLDIENYALNHAQSGFMGSGLSIPNLIRSLVGINKEQNKDVTDNMADDKDSNRYSR